MPGILDAVEDLHDFVGQLVDGRLGPPNFRGTIIYCKRIGVVFDKTIRNPIPGKLTRIAKP